MKKLASKKTTPIPKSGGFSSFLIGIIVAFLSLILLNETSFQAKSFDPNRQNDIQQEVEIEWNFIPDLKDDKKQKFVEANPNTPENVPDQTNQFSFRDQQAAQKEIIEKSHISLNPEVKGEVKSQKIVDSVKQKENNTSPTQVTSKKGSTKNKVTSIKYQEKPIKSKKELEREESEIGSRSQKNLKDGEENKEVSSFSVINNSQNSSTLENSVSLRQKKRPRLSADLIHGPLMKSENQAPRVGMIGIECRLHPYGIYIQEMMQSIEEQWNQLARGSIQFLQRDRLPSTITIRFKLDSTGNITNLTRIDSEGFSLAAELCRQAIASRVPFGKWTDKMINDFGHTDQITISFRYL